MSGCGVVVLLVIPPGGINIVCLIRSVELDGLLCALSVFCRVGSSRLEPASDHLT